MGAAALLNDRDFTMVRELIAQYAGIKLSPQKRNMVYNRLLRRLRARGTASFGDYLALVQQQDSPEREAFVNALTTNLTAFFREPHHFELLATHAQARRGARQPLRVWSSACSTGEEAWSAAMVLRESDCPGEVLGTDIDTEVLQTASSGIYRSDRIAGIPAERLRRHFMRGTGANDGLVNMRPELRSMVKFGQMNLLSPAWPAQRAVRRDLLPQRADLLRS